MTCFRQCRVCTGCLTRCGAASRVTPASQQLLRPDLPETHVIDLEGEFSGVRSARKGDSPESTGIDSGEAR